MDLKTFEGIKEVSKLAKEYNQKAEVSEGEQKKIYEQFVSELDNLYDQLLGIGKYSEDKEPEIEGVMNKTVNGIASYTRVDIIKKYGNGMCLVFDTSPEAFLVPIDSVTEMK